MKNQRIKQMALSILIVLSLFASSYAACGCAHHQEKVEADAISCHQEMAEMSSDEMPAAAAGNSAMFEASDVCVCAQSAPRVFDKSPNIKIEKQTAAILPRIVVSTELIRPSETFEIVVYAKPFYLSDSFYNIKSPRAPPAS